MSPGLWLGLLLLVGASPKYQENWQMVDLGGLGSPITALEAGDLAGWGHDALFIGCEDGTLYLYHDQSFTTIASLGARINDLALGDGDNDAALELYAGLQNGKVIQIQYLFGSWSTSTVYQEPLQRPITAVAVGDADNSNTREVYFATNQVAIHTCWYVLGTWQHDVVVYYYSGEDVLDMLVADPQSDGSKELYTVGRNHLRRVYYVWGDQWYWEPLENLSAAGLQLRIGDPDRDGQTALYYTLENGKVYEERWENAAWHQSPVAEFSHALPVLCLGDGNLDGAEEIFVGDTLGQLHEIYIMGSTWVPSLVEQGEPLQAGVIADLEGNGQMEIYLGSENGHVYQVTARPKSLHRIWPSMAVADTTLTLHLYGAGFSSGVQEVQLVSPPGFEAHQYAFTTFSVQSDRYLTVTANLQDVATAPYHVVVVFQDGGTDTLRNALYVYPRSHPREPLAEPLKVLPEVMFQRFVVAGYRQGGVVLFAGATQYDGYDYWPQVYRIVQTPGHTWEVERLWNFYNDQNQRLTGLALGQTFAGDPPWELYIADLTHLFRAYPQGDSWHLDTLLAFQLPHQRWLVRDVVVSDLQPDRRPEIYAILWQTDSSGMAFEGSQVAVLRPHAGDTVFQFVGPLSPDSLVQLTAGDGDHDGLLELYSVSSNGHAYEISYSGSAYQITDLGAVASSPLKSVAVGDADRDGLEEVVVSSQNGHVYLLKYTAGVWNITDLGNPGVVVRSLSVGDGDADGLPEIYGGGSGPAVRIAWTGTSWEITSLPSSGLRPQNAVVPVPNLGQQTVGLVVADSAERLLLYHHQLPRLWSGFPQNQGVGGSATFHFYGANLPVLPAFSSFALTQNGITYPASSVNSPGGRHMEATFSLASAQSGRLYSVVYAIPGFEDTLPNLVYLYHPENPGDAAWVWKIVYSSTQRIPFYCTTADLDQNGLPELYASWFFLAGDTVGEQMGQLRWADTAWIFTPLPGSWRGHISTSPVVGRVLDHGPGELYAVTSAGQLLRWTYTPARGWSFRILYETPRGDSLSALLVGDLDADGTSEVAFADDSLVYAYDIHRSDTTVLIVGPTGGPAYDLALANLDIAQEPNQQSPLELFLANGSDSLVVFEWNAHNRTYHRSVVAVLPSSGGLVGLLADPRPDPYAVELYAVFQDSGLYVFRNEDQREKVFRFTGGVQILQMGDPDNDAGLEIYLIKPSGTTYRVAGTGPWDITDLGPVGGMDAQISDLDGDGYLEFYITSPDFGLVSGSPDRQKFLTQVVPNAVPHDTTVPLTLYGLGFAYRDVTEIRIFNATHTYTFTHPTLLGDSLAQVTVDFTHLEPGLYTVSLHSTHRADTLPAALVVYSRIPSPSGWTTEDLGFSGNRLRGIALGDGDNDGQPEVYVASLDDHVYQYHLNADSVTWSVEALADLGNWVNDVAVGDGDNDNQLEVYATTWDGKVYELQWNGSSWEVSSATTPNNRVNYAVTVGDGNNDGSFEIFTANADGHVYMIVRQPSWWNVYTIANVGGFDVAVGDGDNDGLLEVYLASGNGHVYEISYENAAWTTTDLGAGTDLMIGVEVADGDNDGLLEVYAAGLDHHVYQFVHTDTGWVKNDLGDAGARLRDVAVGDGDNDGLAEVYVVAEDNRIVQFSWTGTTWTQETVGTTQNTGTSYPFPFRVAVGDGNGNGHLEVYAVHDNGHLYQAHLKSRGALALWPSTVTNQQPVRLVVTGQNLGVAPLPTFRLISLAGHPLVPTHLQAIHPHAVLLTFDLTGADTGVYHLQSKDQGYWNTLKACLTITPNWGSDPAWRVTTAPPVEMGTLLVSGDADHNGRLEIYGYDRQRQEFFALRWNQGTYQKDTLEYLLEEPSDLLCGVLPPDLQEDLVALVPPGDVYRVHLDAAGWTTERILQLPRDTLLQGTLGDVDRDLQPEIYLIGQRDSWFFLDQAVYTDAGWQWSSVDSFSTPLYDLCTGDADLDGYPELYLLNNGQVLQYHWTGTLWSSDTLSQVPGGRGIQATDLDHNDTLDLLVLSDSGTLYRVYPSPWQRQTLASLGKPVSKWALGDVDLDGVPEVYVTSETEPLLLFRIHPTASRGWAVEALPGLVRAPTALAVAEVQPDGLPELFATSSVVGSDLQVLTGAPEAAVQIHPEVLPVDTTLTLQLTGRGFTAPEITSVHLIPVLDGSEVSTVLVQPQGSNTLTCEISTQNATPGPYRLEIRTLRTRWLFPTLVYLHERIPGPAGLRVVVLHELFEYEGISAADWGNANAWEPDSAYVFVGTVDGRVYQLSWTGTQWSPTELHTFSDTVQKLVIADGARTGTPHLFTLLSNGELHEIYGTDTAEDWIIQGITSQVKDIVVGDLQGIGVPTVYITDGSWVKALYRLAEGWVADSLHAIPAAHRLALGDADLDHETELYVASDSGLARLYRSAGTWALEWIASGTVLDVAVADLHHDGTPEVYYLTPSGSQATLHRAEYTGGGWSVSAIQSLPGAQRLFSGPLLGTGGDQVAVGGTDTLWLFKEDADGVFLAWRLPLPGQLYALMPSISYQSGRFRLLAGLTAGDTLGLLAELSPFTASPTITHFTPTAGIVDTLAEVHFLGPYLHQGRMPLAIKLVQGNLEIVGQSLHRGAAHDLVCTFNLTGLNPGVYRFVVQWPHRTDTIAQDFQVHRWLGPPFHWVSDQVYELPDTLDQNILDLTWGDVDRDGLAEMYAVVERPISSSEYVVELHRLDWNHGRLQDTLLATTEPVQGWNGSRVTIGDGDNDAQPEFYITTYGGHLWQVDPPNYVVTCIESSTVSYTAPAVGDADGDGLMEVYYVITPPTAPSLGSDTLVQARWNGHTWEKRRLHGATNPPYIYNEIVDLAVADLDYDGSQEVYFHYVSDIGDIYYACHVYPDTTWLDTLPVSGIGYTMSVVGDADNDGQLETYLAYENVFQLKHSSTGWTLTPLGTLNLMVSDLTTGPLFHNSKTQLFIVDAEFYQYAVYKDSVWHLDTLQDQRRPSGARAVIADVDQDGFVEYYLCVNDTLYRYRGIDQSPPTIDSVTQYLWRSGTDSTRIRARVADGTGVDSVFLWYQRMQQDTGWVRVPMTLVGKGAIPKARGFSASLLQASQPSAPSKDKGFQYLWYEAWIPGAQWLDTVRYAIQAYDVYGYDTLVPYPDAYEYVVEPPRPMLSYPPTAPDSGRVVLRFLGPYLGETSPILQLRKSSDGYTITGSNVQVLGRSHVSATFNLTGVPTGWYTPSVVVDGYERSYPHLLFINHYVGAYAEHYADSITLDFGFTRYLFHIAVGDVDNDNRDEIFLAPDNSNFLVWGDYSGSKGNKGAPAPKRARRLPRYSLSQPLASKTSGKLETWTAFIIAGYQNVYQLLVAECNNDSLPDLIVVGYYDDGEERYYFIDVYYADEFVLSYDFTCVLDTMPDAVAVGNANNDSTVEFYTVERDGFVRMYWDYGWESDTVRYIGVPANHRVMDLAIGDADNDGEQEIYVADGGRSVYQIRWNGGAWVKQAIAQDLPLYATQVAITDADGDGLSELYVAAGGEGEKSTLRLFQFVYSSGTWQRQEIASWPVNHDHAWDLMAGDATNHGTVSLFLLSQDVPLQRVWYENHTWHQTTLMDHTVSGASSYAVPSHILDLGDFNGDGLLELYEMDSTYVDWYAYILSYRTRPILWVSEVYPATLPVDTTLTLTVLGEGFDPARGLTVSLVQVGGNTVIPAQDIQVIHRHQVLATFQLADASPGTYTLVVSDRVASDTLPQGVVLYQRAQGPWTVDTTRIEANPLGQEIRGLEILDLDEDGQNELYAIHGGSLEMFQGDGTTWTHSTVASFSSEIQAIAVGDGDHDHHPEIYVTTQSGVVYQISLASSRAFPAARRGIAPSSDPKPHGHSFNSLASSKGAPLAQWNPPLRSGYTVDTVTYLPADNHPTALTLGTHNTLGMPCLYFLTNGKRALFQLFHHPDADSWIFGSIYNWSGKETRCLDAGDYDQDGFAEVFVGFSNGDVEVVDYTDSTGWFSLQIANLEGDTLTALSVTDADGDGQPEVYAITPTRLFKLQHTEGKGWTTLTIHDWGTQMTALATGPVRHTSLSQALSGDRATGHLYLSEKGSPYWTSDTLITFSNPITALITGDVDHDGLTETYVGIYPDHVFHLFLRPLLVGDINQDQQINALDIEALAQYLYYDGPAPDPLEVADVNGDHVVNDQDLVALSRQVYGQRKPASPPTRRSVRENPRFPRKTKKPQDSLP